MKPKNDEIIAALRGKLIVRDAENKQLREDLTKAQDRFKRMTQRLEKEVDSIFAYIKRAAKEGKMAAREEEVARKLAQAAQYKLKAKKREAELLA